MSAVDVLIADLMQNRYSVDPQNIIAPVDDFVAALQQIQSGLGPPITPQPANDIYAGPASGGPALPTFRALVPADLPIATVGAFGAVKPDGTSITIAAGVISAPSGGSGTVTSVGLTMPAIFAVSGSPIVGAGTLAVTLANENVNLVFAGPGSGGAAAPTFRALVAADIPSLAGTYLPLAGGVLTGTLTADDGGTWGATGINGSNIGALALAEGHFTNLSATGTFVLPAVNPNLVFAGPTSGGAMAPTFRALTAADIPSLSGIYLPLAGGTMTGTIVGDDAGTWSATGISHVSIGATGAKDAHFTTLNASGASDLLGGLLVGGGANVSGGMVVSGSGTGFSALTSASITGTLVVTGECFFNGGAAITSTPFMYTENVNAQSYLRITNANAGAAASGGVKMSNGPIVTDFMLLGDGFATIGDLVASATIINTDAGGSGGHPFIVTQDSSTAHFQVTAAGDVIIKQTLTVQGTLTLANQTANHVFAGPGSGGAAAPTFRALVAADLPLATVAAFGAVKPDGSTITISAGVISAAGGGGGVPSIAGTANEIDESGSPGATTLSLSATMVAPGSLTMTGAFTGADAGTWDAGGISTGVINATTHYNILGNTIITDAMGDIYFGNTGLPTYIQGHGIQLASGQDLNLFSNAGALNLYASTGVYQLYQALPTADPANAGQLFTVGATAPGVPQTVWISGG